MIGLLIVYTTIKSRTPTSQASSTKRGQDCPAHRIDSFVTGSKCETDLFKDNLPTDGRALWPERKSLPSIQGIWLGWVIEGCWDGEFRSVHSLLRALNSVIIRFSSPVAQSRTSRFLASISNIVRDRPITTIIGVLGLAVFTLIVGRKIFQMSRGFCLSLRFLPVFLS